MNFNIEPNKKRTLKLIFTIVLAIIISTLFTLTLRWFPAISLIVLIGTGAYTIIYKLSDLFEWLIENVIDKLFERWFK